jgi:excinuclease ABC subunit A
MLGTFSETNWNHRSVIEIPLAKKSDGWFLHAITGHEAYVKFVFRMPGRPFKEEQLNAKLKLKPLSDTPGLEGYSRDSTRVEVAHGPGVQHVVIIVHKKEEIETPAFREFLERAVEVVQARAATAAGGVEGNMPWKKDGEKWHLGEKGFPPGKQVKWDRSLLSRLYSLIKEIDPQLEFKWDVRDAITIRPPGSSRFWCRIKTKESASLEAWFVGRKGLMNLSRVEGIGQRADIEGDRNDGTEILKLWFTTTDTFQPLKLKPLLTEHLKGFRSEEKVGR